MVNIPGYTKAGNGYSKPGDIVIIELSDKPNGLCYAGQAVGVYPLLFNGRLLRKISEGSGTQPTIDNNRFMTALEVWQEFLKAEGRYSSGSYESWIEQRLNAPKTEHFTKR